ncbi:MAG TPA: hypothetical protein PK694_07310, partial [Rhodospirillales bacterium]|nr:hypothetical protein [Rhodospirillales bacterium]
MTLPPSGNTRIASTSSTTTFTSFNEKAKSMFLAEAASMTLMPFASGRWMTTVSPGAAEFVEVMAATFTGCSPSGAAASSGCPGVARAPVASWS